MYACDRAMCLSKVSSGLPAIWPPTLSECWPNVCDAGPSFRQRCAVFLVLRQCCNQQRHLPVSLDPLLSGNIVLTLV